MPSSNPAPSRARTLLTRAAVVTVGAALATTSFAAAPAAHASSASSASSASAAATAAAHRGHSGHANRAHAHRGSHHMSPRQKFEFKAHRVLNVVRNHRGDPYRYGATGPHAFDCSGLVYYTFQKALGRTLPRTANEQKVAAHRIWHRQNLRPGDLVFETNSGGYAYHVGIYAGHGYFWNAPHTGSHVQKEKMYSAHWRYGRIISS